jgi:hypothetical protein
MHCPKLSTSYIVSVEEWFHIQFFFLIPVCEAVGTADTPGLLCQRRMIAKMIVEKQME